MLDTNIVSHLINQHPAVVAHVVAATMASLCISAITAGAVLVTNDRAFHHVGNLDVENWTV